MKLGLLFLVLLSYTTTIKGGDEEAVVSQQVTVAISNGDTSVINNAVNSGETAAVASAFSTAQQTGNSKILSQFIYQVMSTNPPGSIMSNTMLDIMETMIINDGCNQIDQIVKEIDSLIDSDEVSKNLQTAFLSSQDIMDCVPRVAPAFAPDQDLCVESSTGCIFLDKDNKYLKNYSQYCHVIWTCNFNGYRSSNQCIQKCEN